MSTELAPVVGRQEIAALLGVTISTVRAWEQRRATTGFPFPEYIVNALPCWATSTILAWARETGRAGYLGGSGPARVGQSAHQDQP